MRAALLARVTWLHPPASGTRTQEPIMSVPCSLMFSTMSYIQLFKDQDTPTLSMTRTNDDWSTEDHPIHENARNAGKC